MEEDVGWPGKHILIDMHGIKFLDESRKMEMILLRACSNAGATILHSYFHKFEGGGYTGVILLAESHVSIHTWPEKEFAAIDIFMCGKCNPEDALWEIIKALEPKSYNMINRVRDTKYLLS